MITGPLLLGRLKLVGKKRDRTIFETFSKLILNVGQERETIKIEKVTDC